MDNRPGNLPDRDVNDLLFEGVLVEYRLMALRRRGLANDNRYVVTALQKLWILSHMVVLGVSVWSPEGQEALLILRENYRRLLY